MENEKRKSVRIKKPLVVQYSRDLNAINKIWGMANVKDISATGMCIIADTAIPVNETVNLRIKLPTRPFDWLEFNGRIVKSEGSVTRIEFMDLEAEKDKLIKEYIGWFLSKEGGKK